jgi:very-short-patch-repair endonuclease
MVLEVQENKLCEFCGKVVKQTSKYHLKRFCNFSCSTSFVNMHRDYSKSKYKSGRNHKNFGKKRTEKYKKEQSKRTSGENNGMFKKKHSNESKKKMSETRKIYSELGLYEKNKNKMKIFMSKRMKNKSYEEIYGKEVANKLKKSRSISFSKGKITEKRIESCRKNGLKFILSEKNRGKFFDTKPELEMKEILDKLNIKYYHQIWKEKILCDFYLPKENCIIEVDGKYWHNYPKGNTKDKIRTKELKKIGYNVLRFWEKEFNIEKVKMELKNLKNKKWC